MTMNSEFQSFEVLPPDMQKTVIDWCVKERQLQIIHEGNLLKLPNMLQLTYFCKKCGVSYPIRMYSFDIIQGRYAKHKQCPDCNTDMYIAHKTIPLDHTLIVGKKRKVHGLKSFFEE